MTETAAETEQPSTLDWIWGALQGDFNENPSVGQIIANAAITAIPLVDQVGDARDLVANLKALIWEKRYAEIAVWAAIFFTLIGLIPTLGSLLKGVLKVIYRGGKLDDVFKVFNGLATGNAKDWLKKLHAGELRQHADEATRMLKQVFDNIINTLNQALAYVPHWAGDLYRQIQDLIGEMQKLRDQIGEMFGKITKDLEEKIDDLLKKEVDNSVEGDTRQTLMKRQEAEKPPPERPPITREQRIEELAADPAHDGRISPKSQQEAEVGLSLEESGHLKGPIVRDPRPDGGEFIDADGTVWDVKAFDSRWPPKKGGFKLMLLKNSNDAIMAHRFF